MYKVEPQCRLLILCLNHYVILQTSSTKETFLLIGHSRQIHLHHWKNTTMCIIFFVGQKISLYMKGHYLKIVFMSKLCFLCEKKKIKFHQEIFKQTGEKYLSNSIQKQTLSKKDLYSIFPVGWYINQIILSYCSTVLLFHSYCDCTRTISSTPCLWDVLFSCVCDVSWELFPVHYTVLLVSTFLHQTLEWLVSSWLC